MSSSSLTLIFFFTSTFLYAFSHSFNITDILNKKDDFSTFNKLLSQTQLASTINNRQTITVLAISNNALSSLSDRSSPEIKNILSLHIILDYYDIKKLKNLKNKTVILTTLLQTSGQAKGNQGFLNATVKSNGDVVFGSAVPGSILNSRLIDSVAAEPFNISVLHISSAIPIMIDPPNDSPYVARSPLPAQPPNDDAYTDPDEAPSPPSSSPAAAADAEPPSEKADSTSGVSRINSQLHLPFTLVIYVISLVVHDDLMVKIFPIKKKNNSDQLLDSHKRKKVSTTLKEQVLKKTQHNPRGSNKVIDDTRNMEKIV